MTTIQLPAPPTFEGWFIGGEIVAPAGPAEVELECPANGEVYAVVPRVTPADVDRAATQARASFERGDWRRLDVRERVAVIRRATELVETSLDDITTTAAFEIGAPVRITQNTIGTAVTLVRRLCDIALATPDVEEATGLWEYAVQRDPLGVVAILSPWNGPVFETIVKSSMALLAGCSVICKPPPTAPFGGQFWADAVMEAGLPRGVLSILPAHADGSEYLVSHPDVDKVVFTGGTEIGRRVAELCGRHLKRVGLELGGKSAAVVLDDADLDVVAQAVAASTFFNSGQVCSALSRVVAPRHLVDEVSDRIAARGRAMLIGDPFDADTVMGPLATRQHQQRVQGYVASGTEQGAHLVTGGVVPTGLEAGAYFEPTVFSHVANSMRIAQEEIFGPVVSVIAHDGEDSAVQIANDSPFGLGGSVFSRDEERAYAVGGRLRTGAVTLNAYTSNFLAPRAPHKDSGIGVMTGLQGYQGFRSSRVVNTRPAAGAFTPGAALGK